LSELVQTPFIEKHIKLSEIDKAKILQPEDVARVIIELAGFESKSNEENSSNWNLKVIIDKLGKMKLGLNFFWLNCYLTNVSFTLQLELN